KLADIRPEFSVFVIDADFAAAEPLVRVIKNAGYDAKFFPTFDSAMNGMRQLPPHIVIFNLESFATNADDYLLQIRQFSSEVLTILLASGKQAIAALQLVERDLAFDYQVRPYISPLDLIQKLDRAAQRLYFQFESEQLREAADAGQAVLPAPAVASGPVTPAPAPSAPSGPRVDPSILEPFISKISIVKDLEATVQAFIDSLSAQMHNAPTLYFKYVPHYFSLVLSQSAWLPIEKIRGIGVELKSIQPARIGDAFQNPATIEPLKSLLKEAFRAERYFAFTHSSDGDVLGVTVIFDPMTEPGKLDIARAYQGIFDLAYKRNLVLKEKHALEIFDSLTGLHNRKFFSEKIDDEISRSRRISLPLSLVTINIDGFESLNKEIGFHSGDTILKMLGALLKKSMRANDIIARVGPDEFVMLLAHTPHMGAAVKAERLRRVIEATRIPVLEGRKIDHITVSIGVSEYPAFCNDSDGLVKSADEALFEVKKAGGNKVCLASVPPGFVPDFVPEPAKDIGRGKR
ncbi:MAG: diguanylate cyclase, partial [Bdellovibrionaceae bacterium]|nr:diguanylate cyclase [Pseudobdellovibrionaceae bacterium]